MPDDAPKPEPADEPARSLKEGVEAPRAGEPEVVVRFVRRKAEMPRCPATKEEV